MQFIAKIKIHTVNPYINVSAIRANKIQPNWRRALPVQVRINGKPNPPWRINMMPKGDGSFYLYLHGDVRKASQTKVGDEVSVDVTFDATYKNGPMHPVPPWFQKALDDNPEAKQNWIRLIPSRQKEILRYLSQLKTTKAQIYNTQKAIQVLSGHNDRFMARSWRNGS